ncbi:Hypothetical predicted protein [Mytilus galloprovincialis]|uniref:Uncharacterized protein n=1 Tax=Mytilus galloprovincialis TaxID=29158 RepID=A0A8B6H1X1_MYTGA|nr:Hypothetical predicted protein [Mytilus galloprovincialis]
MYEMQNNIQQQQLGPENPEVPVYSSIDRRHHLSIGNAVSYSVTRNKKPNPLGCRMQQKGDEHKKTNMAGMSTPNRNENEELNYIEVCFDKKPQNLFKIHGLEERSDYVEIDFTKTVDRLPDCDKDDVSDDDFVSLEDVKSMKRKTQFTN